MKIIMVCLRMRSQDLPVLSPRGVATWRGGLQLSDAGLLLLSRSAGYVRLCWSRSNAPNTEMRAPIDSSFRKLEQTEYWIHDCCLLVSKKVGFSHAHLANLGWMCIRYLVYQVVCLGISLARLESLGLHVHSVQGVFCWLLPTVIYIPGSTWYRFA